MAWMRSHQSAYRKAVESFFSSPWYFPPAGLAQGAYAQEGGSPWPDSEQPPAPGGSCHQYPHAGGPEPGPRGREEPAWSAEEEEEEQEEESESDDGGIECDLSNMEITEELRQYFAQTERHREERRESSLRPLPASVSFKPSAGYREYFQPSPEPGTASMGCGTSAIYVSRVVLV